MSAINTYLGVSEAMGPDGVARYSSRIKVLVHSHQSDRVLDLSNDVENCGVSKTLRNAGSAQIAVVARVDLMSMVFPDDYINIYFNISDGEGWTRTFFGFVDKIEEEYSVTGNGEPQSRYIISCTDFQKAVERTHIYFNPHIAGRDDISSRFFGQNNIGGIQALMRGVTVHGSPADIVQNLLFVFLGYGTQYLVPTSYAADAREALAQLRSERQDYIIGRLPEDIQAVISGPGGIEGAQRQAAAEARDEVARQISEEQAITSTQGAQQSQLDYLANPDLLDDQVEAFAAAFESRVDAATQARIANLFNNDFQTRGLVTTTLSPTTPLSLLDVMDPITFVEMEAIDGYTAGAPTNQQEGPVMNLLQSMSHDPINELFFDLRPVTVTGGLKSEEYSRDDDEVKGNVAEFNDPNGIKYVPAVVMREYPFSTISHIDASYVELLDDGSTVGIIPFGAIFSDAPNLPGRHIVTIPSINLRDRALGNTDAQGRKHLDVAVIHPKEIIRSSIGRSDHEHFNLTEFWSDSILGSDATFFMSDVVPIITPVHIIQHGLRVKSISTRFARFSIGEISRVEMPPEPQETPPEESVQVLPEHPNEEDIPPGPNWRAAQAMAAAYGVGLNVYVLARTMHSEYGMSESEAATYDIADGTKVVAWAAINIARTAYRPGTPNRVPFGRNPDGSRKYSTTNVMKAICPTGEFGGFGSGRPQSTARFVGESSTAQATARRGRFRVNLTPSQQVLVDKYFDAARRMLRGEAGWGDPTTVGGATITFAHCCPPSAEGCTNSACQTSAQRATRAELGEDFYEVPAAPYQVKVTHAYARRDAETAPTSSAPTATAPVVEDPPRQATSDVDSSTTREQILRWALLHDHWYQHSLEYLSGTIQMRPAPEIRVGYRLDILEREISFYVEGVSHQFAYPDQMTTSLQVTRGQPNNPWPLYSLPPTSTFAAPENQRQQDSRLSRFFTVHPVHSVEKSVAIRNNLIDIRENRHLDVDGEAAIAEYNELLIRDGDGGDGRDTTTISDADSAPADGGESHGVSTGGVDGIDTESGLSEGDLEHLREGNLDLI